MYAIGRNCFDYITTTKHTMYDALGVWSEIVKVKYGVPLHKATIVANRGDAEKILKEIRDRVDKIQFQNDSIVGEALDRKNSFDKGEFVKGLKIYELVPREVTE